MAFTFTFLAGLGLGAYGLGERAKRYLYDYRKE